MSEPLKPGFGESGQPQFGERSAFFSDPGGDALAASSGDLPDMGDAGDGILDALVDGVTAVVSFLGELLS